MSQRSFLRKSPRRIPQENLQKGFFWRFSEAAAFECFALFVPSAPRFCEHSLLTRWSALFCPLCASSRENSLLQGYFALFVPSGSRFCEHSLLEWFKSWLFSSPLRSELEAPLGWPQCRSGTASRSRLGSRKLRCAKLRGGKIFCAVARAVVLWC